MPDQPIPRERPAHPTLEATPRLQAVAPPIDDAGRSRRPARAVPYVELRSVTNYSFGFGASHPDELVTRAWTLGYRGLAVTDQNSLAGVVRAYVRDKALRDRIAEEMGRDAGLDPTSDADAAAIERLRPPSRLLYGAELTFADFDSPLVMWVTDRDSYGHLCRLITTGRRRAKKGECHLRLADLKTFHHGLLAGVPLSDWIDRPAEAVDTLGRLQRLLGDRLYGLAELHRGSDDRLQLERMVRLAEAVGVTPVASGAVLYHDRSRRHLHDVITATRLKTPVEQLAAVLQSNGERSLRSTDTIAAIYADHPQLVAATLEVAGRCRFCLSDLRYEYPREIAPDGLTLPQYLRRETIAGGRRRYGGRIPASVRRQIDTELTLIEKRRYEAFFLTVYEAVQFARGRGILCQGRGSAANSAVCFCLGITEVDPTHSNLLFERFLSMARDEAPDIDVDFEHERREEVIQHLYEKYGRERAGIAAAVATYRPRSAIRDVGKALGLSQDRVDALARHIGRWKLEGPLDECFEDAGIDPSSTLARRMTILFGQLLGFPRYLSQHSGGMVLTDKRLDESVPIENAAMAGRTVVQWDKDDLAAAGLLKVDVLALGMLTAVRRCFDLVTQHYRPLQQIAAIPADDPATYAMIQAADTIGVFQIESRAQMSMLPRLRPKCFYDLVIEVAIVRPGPIQGDMVHPYLRRRDGLEEVDYPSDDVREVLERTLGVPIFQEQAMELAKVAAGFSAEEADQFRRAIGAWRSTGLIDQFEQRLKSGLAGRGYSGEFGERLFKQIRGFGEYGFPESHAASFALLVYASCWLKCHYPAAFCVALLNSQPMGFYHPAQLVADARKHGIEVRGVDVNFSEPGSTLEPLQPDRPPRPQESRRQTGTAHVRDQCAIRLGFHMVKGLSESEASQLVARRGKRAYRTYDELAARSGLQPASLRRLADAGAFGSLDLDRRSSTWAARPGGVATPLLPAADEPIPKLPPMSESGEVTADYLATGLSLRGHPMQFLREQLATRGVTPIGELDRKPAGARLTVAGLVLLRQQPGSAHGVVFMTLEDETGTTNLIFWPSVWAAVIRIARVATGLVVTGELQRQRGVIHIVVESIENLTDETIPIKSQSRDFH